MTSNVSATGINVNFPIQGVINNSQGFRDNFSAIATAITETSSEITELQQNRETGPTGSTDSDIDSYFIQAYDLPN